jgi:hypothetical protein
MSETLPTEENALNIEERRAAKMFPKVPGAPAPKVPEPDLVAEKMFNRTTQEGAEGVPEFYDLRTPPGLEHLNFDFNDDTAIEFQVMARKHGLSQTTAQKLVDFHLTKIYGKKGR